MTTGVRRCPGLLIIIAIGCLAQRQSLSTDGATGDACSIGVSNQAIPDPRNVVRAMDDRNTNLRWLLVKDEEHPSGPGRLVPIPAWPRDYGAVRDSTGLQRLGFAPVRLLIKAGDRVVVEERNRAFDARFEAVALESASTGSNLRVRLKLGGRIVQTVATGPGLVEMVTGREEHR